jgi:translation initiation factor IF-3
MQIRRRSPRPPPQMPVKDTTPINEAIDAQEMRVLVDDGAGKDELLGVMSKEEALAAAEERELDLVLINDKQDPVVCKIISYDKFRFANEKRKKDQRKAASKSKSELKELKMSYKVGQHDYGVRKKQAVKFLSRGDKVKFTMQFRGREMTHANVGKDVLMKMANELEDYGTLDSTPKVMGKAMIMMISPKQRVKEGAGASAVASAGASAGA